MENVEKDLCQRVKERLAHHREHEGLPPAQAFPVALLEVELEEIAKQTDKLANALSELTKATLQTTIEAPKS